MILNGLLDPRQLSAAFGKSHPKSSLFFFLNDPPPPEPSPLPPHAPLPFGTPPTPYPPLPVWAGLAPAIKTPGPTRGMTNQEPATPPPRAPPPQPMPRAVILQPPPDPLEG